MTPLREGELTPEALEHSRPDALAPHEAADATRDIPARLSRNVRWNFAGQFWTFAVTIVATPIIIRRLGADAYGIIAALAVVTNYMAFLDLGLSQTAIRYVAEFRASKSWRDVRSVFWSSLAIYLTLGLLAGALMALLSPVAATRWFRIPPGLQPAAASAFLVGAAGVALVLVNFGPAALIRGFERFDLVNKVGILVGTTQPVVTLLLVLAGATIPAIVAANVVVLAGSVLLNFVLARKVFPAVTRPDWDRQVFLRLLRFGGYLAAASLLAPLAVNAEKLLLAGSVSVAALTYYMVPQSLLARLAIIPASFSSALFPTFTALHTAGDVRRNARLNVEVTRTLVHVFTPILVVLLLFGDQLLSLWMGADFARQSGHVLKVLAVAAFIQSLAWSPHMLIQAVGRSDVTFRVYVIEVLLYLPVAFFAVRWWGLTGAAVAWLVRVTLDSALVWYYSGRLAALSPRAAAADPRVIGALAGIAFLIVSNVAPIESASVRGLVDLTGALLALLSVMKPLSQTLLRLVRGRLADSWEVA